MSQRAFFTAADGCKLEFEVSGTGRPVLWQHGLGAPFTQPAEVFPHVQGLQRITLACRGHENSELGDPAKLSIPSFADDALALLDHLGIAMAAVGGISLGAGIALRLAAYHPQRVTKAVLARPAWVDGPSLQTQAAYLAVADLIARYPLAEGLELIQRHPAYVALVQTSPDNAKSILGYFSRPRPETTTALLSHISSSSPQVPRADIARIDVPVLVIGNAEDVVHPIAYARALAALVPGSQLAVITSKTINARAYGDEFRQALAKFLWEAP